MLDSYNLESVLIHYSVCYCTVLSVLPGNLLQGILQQVNPVQQLTSLQHEYFIIATDTGSFTRGAACSLVGCRTVLALV